MRDPHVEQLLHEHGVAEYSYDEAIGLRSIDLEASARNQARFQSIHEDQVILYAEALESGEELPPIVVYRNGSGKHIVIDGNHRIQAHLVADRKNIMGYVVKHITPAQVLTLTFEANARHGLPTSMAERLAQAMILVEGGASAREAARMLKMPEERITNELKTARTVKRLEVMGFRKANAWPATIRKRLGNIHSDVVLARAAALVDEFNVGADQVSRLVTAVNNERSEVAQLQVLDAEREKQQATVASTAGQRIPLPRNFKGVTHALATLATMNVRTLSVDRLSREHKKRIGKQIVKVQANLERLTKAVSE
jgi:DNA-binding Lrp family transcriptional regulator